MYVMRRRHMVVQIWKRENTTDQENGRGREKKFKIKNPIKNIEFEMK